jgi:UDP-N-acetyl-D-glucosamine dehydrogenase
VYKRQIEGLEKAGAEVEYFDPFVSEYTVDGVVKKGNLELSSVLIESTDLTIVTTAHTNIDYYLVQRHSKAIFDTKNAMKHIESRNNIELL